jgi:hyperosmotically inducible periplasmic protein
MIMQGMVKWLGPLLTVVLSAGLLAASSGAAGYDAVIESKVTQKLADKKDFRNVRASTEDGIVALSGTVELYQQKLDAAKKVRKIADVQGVRNLIEVGSIEPDADLAAALGRRLYYDRIGYDNVFNFVDVSVKNGVATLNGETRTDVGRDSAIDLVGRTPGVKDIVNNITVAPASNFDDRIRLSALRAIYRDPVLNRYAIDPALPIRIIVDNGKLTLYGTVMNSMDKQVAGIRAGQVFGVFKVQNKLEVAKQS